MLHSNQQSKLGHYPDLWGFAVSSCIQRSYGQNVQSIGVRWCFWRSAVLGRCGWIVPYFNCS